MLSRPHRLHRQADIIMVVRTGQKIVTPYMIIHYIKHSPGQTLTRIACVVGKKVSPSAVQRHRYQRWLRVLTKENIPSLSHGAYDMVWVGRASLNEVRQLADLRLTLITPLKKLLA